MADAVPAVPSADGAVGSSAQAVVATPAAAPGYRHPSGIVPTLQNVVSTVNLGCKLDLAAIAQSARNAEYNPKRFAACIVRIREPKTTALMFNSGKMVIAGAKSEEASRLAARKACGTVSQYTKILMKLGYAVSFREFTVQNMVASCSVNFPIRLEGLAVRFDMFCSYEPEVFPGLVFRMRNPTVVLLIFVTGKIVITGAKKVEQIYQAFDNVYAVLQDFRKDDARRIVRTATLPSASGPVPALPGPSSALADAGIGTITGVPQDIIQDAAATAPAGPLVPPPRPAVVLPPPAMLPVAGVPPPTPASGGSIPPPTPMHGNFIPPPTPVQGNMVPPPTPLQGTLIPPPTPVQGNMIPPPTPSVPHAGSVPPPTPSSHMLPPPTL